MLEEVGQKIVNHYKGVEIIAETKAHSQLLVYDKKQPVIDNPGKCLRMMGLVFTFC